MEMTIYERRYSVDFQSYLFMCCDVHESSYIVWVAFLLMAAINENIHGPVHAYEVEKTARLVCVHHQNKTSSKPWDIFNKLYDADCYLADCNELYVRVKERNTAGNVAFRWSFEIH